MRIPSGFYIDNPAWPLLQSQISYWGISTAVGNALGTTLVDAQCGTAGLQPSYVGLSVKILDGGAAGQVRNIAVHALATGTITVANPFTDSAGAVQQIAAGTRFVILSAGGGGGGAPAPVLAPSIGLWMFGEVSPAAPGSTTVHPITNLAGFPDDIFNNEFWMQVIHNDNSVGAAPEREWRRITDYVGATGTFTTDAFTVNVEANDLVAIVHESIVGIEILGFGTLDTSSATVPADSTRPEGLNYFRGMLLMTTEGAVRFQPRRIVTSSAAGVFTLDPSNPFTAVSGEVDYVIIGDQTEFVPAADAVINRTPADVIGNKESTAIYTPDVVSDVIRYLKGILNSVNTGAEPSESLIETWQDLAIDPSIWTITNPAGGAAWVPAVSGAFLYITTTPNLNETARLVGDHLWQLHSITPNLNFIVKKTIIEFTMIIGVPANVDNAQTIFGFTPGAGNTRASQNIIGFGLVGDALQTITDLGGVETVNTGFGETLTNQNKYRIEVYEGFVDFYLNEVRIAQHAANIPNIPSYPDFFIDTDAGGACALSIGIIKIWYEMVERY